MDANEPSLPSSNPDRAGSEPIADLCEYYICQNGAIYGPVDLTTIAAWIGEGRVTPRDWLFIPSLCDWVPILEVPEMAGCFYNAIEKPIGPPPGLPVQIYLKYYKSQDKVPDGSESVPQLVEKRQWLRIPVNAHMSFWEVTELSAVLTDKYEAFTLNISEGGLAFEWTQPMEPGQILELRVDFFPVTLHAAARVVRCAPKDDGAYVIGVAFRNLAVTERDKIRHFIRSCIHTSSKSAPGHH